MGVLSQYKEGTLKDTYKDKKRAPKRRYFDCEADLVCRVKTLSSGVSKNKKKTQRMNQAWLAANMELVRINSQGIGKEDSQMHVGGTVDWHKWLPRGTTPEEMSVKEQFDISEIHEFGAAIIRLIPDYVSNDLVDQLFDDDGKYAQGVLIGVSTDASPSEDMKKDENGNDTDEPAFYFFNAHFYPVDDGGNRIDPMTPDELAAANAAKA